MSHTHGQGFADQIAEFEAKLARQAEAQEPCAWAVYWGVGEMRRNSVHFEYKSAMDAASHIRSVTEIRPLFTRPQPATDDRIADLESERDSIRAVNAELVRTLEKCADHLNGPTAWTQEEEDLLSVQVSAAIASARKQENAE